MQSCGVFELFCLVYPGSIISGIIWKQVMVNYMCIPISKCNHCYVELHEAKSYYDFQWLI